MAASHDSLNRLLTHTPGGPLQFVGTVNETANVTIAGQPATVDPTNTFRGPAPTVNGTTTVSITATDPSGNVASRQYEVDITGAPKTFTYDANGNMTSDGTRTFEWDARNQLVAVNVGTQRSEFAYDGSQRRVSMTAKASGAVVESSVTVWCGAKRCEQRAVIAGATRLLFPMGESVDGVAMLLVYDHLNSLSATTSSAGTLQSAPEYDPWGRRVPQPSAPGADFAGLWRLEGHQLATFRAFSADAGRWLSEDPSGYTDGPHLYQYGLNNPIATVDPAGLQGVGLPPPVVIPPTGCTQLGYSFAGRSRSESSRRLWAGPKIDYISIAWGNGVTGGSSTDDAIMPGPCVCTWTLQGISKVTRELALWDVRFKCCSGDVTLSASTIIGETRQVTPVVGSPSRMTAITTGKSFGAACDCDEPKG